MSRARALLQRDLGKEGSDLQKKAAKKDLWSSIGSTAGSLGVMALTGGAVNPLTLGLLTGGASLLGGAAGERLSNTGNLKDQGRFLKSDRNELQTQLGALGTKNVTGAITSGVTAGIGQKLKMMKDVKAGGEGAAKLSEGFGMDFGNSTASKALAKGKDFAGDLSTGFTNTSFDQTTLPDGMSFKDYQSLVAERQGSYAASEAAKTFDFSTLNKDNLDLKGFPLLKQEIGNKANTLKNTIKAKKLQSGNIFGNNMVSQSGDSLNMVGTGKVSSSVGSDIPSLMDMYEGTEGMNFTSIADEGMALPSSTYNNVPTDFGSIAQNNPDTNLLNKLSSGTMNRNKRNDLHSLFFPSNNSSYNFSNIGEKQLSDSFANQLQGTLRWQDKLNLGTK